MAATIRCEVVSPERLVFSEDVLSVLVPGVAGQMGILPRHAPLMTILTIGEIVVKRQDGSELYFAVSGGFVEVRPDKVVILADAAERSDEIDIERAEQAQERAETLLQRKLPPTERAPLELALRRAHLRLKIARRRAGRAPRPISRGEEEEKV